METEKWVGMGKSLEELVEEWKRVGLVEGWGEERFEVWEEGGKVVFGLEGGGLGGLGVMREGVEVKGVVEREGGWDFWIGGGRGEKGVWWGG